MEGWSSGTTLHSIIPALNIGGVPLREIHWSALASTEILFAKGQMAVACIGSIATCLCSKKYNACSSQCVPGRARIAAMPPSLPYLSLPVPFLGPSLVWGICTLSSLLSSSVNTCLYPYPAWNWVKRKAVPMISLLGRAERLPALVLGSLQSVH